MSPQTYRNAFGPLVIVTLLVLGAEHVNSKVNSASGGRGDKCSRSYDAKWPLTTPSSPEKAVVRSGIAIKALMTNTHPDPENPAGFIAEFWILDVYKGADKLASSLGVLGGPGGVFNLRDQRLNVSHWGDASQCQNTPILQKSYIVLLTSITKPVPASERSFFNHATSHSRPKHQLVARYDDPYSAAVEFSNNLENRVQKALGWHSWSEWSPCSHACGGGDQKRIRTCLTSPKCPSYNVEKRNCNTFKCSSAINTLSVSEDRYFKPSPSAFHRVNGRGRDAWLIRPGSYFLLPFRQAFGRDFPKDFTVFLTLRPTEESEGIIFSINARNSRQEYISLELNEGRLELVHSLANGSKIIDIPARISDGKGWHQLAISVEGGSSVRTYLDCHWITTQILHRHTLAVPENADFIIGYMFQGEIEQLTVSDQAGAVSEQCSATKIPYVDEAADLNAAKAKAKARGQLLHKAASHPVTSKDANNDIDIEEDVVPVRKFSSPSPTSGHDHRSSNPRQSPDYLDEEYVDLDWNEEKKKEAAEAEAEVVKGTKAAPTIFEDVQEERGSGNGAESTSKSGGIDDDEDAGEGSGEVAEKTTQNEAKSKMLSQKKLNSAGEDDEEEGSGGGFAIEWSSWGECSAPCGQGRQTRSSRCVDNGLMEECIEAGMERQEHRVCHAHKACHAPAKDSDAIKYNPAHDWVPVVAKKGGKHEPKSPIITGKDIVNHHKHHPQRPSFSDESLTRPSPVPAATKVEEHTNAIPNGVPNYWVPAEKKDQQEDVERAFCHPGCQNGGSCIAPFKCLCPPGVSGNFCEEFSCRPGCSNGGICIGPDECSCPHGFSGRDCRERTCTTHCENGGVCTMPSNKCKCPQGFYGQRCHKRVCARYVAVKEPHKRFYQQVVDVEYESVCGNGEPCVKTRPEYKTTFKTVYRTSYRCATDADAAADAATNDAATNATMTPTESAHSA